MKRSARWLAAGFFVAVTGPVQADAAYTNRLAGSADPYLLEHAHNPVDWYPWGPEAFAKARAEDKPIFLSIGYSTCYWCHVAEKTIYSVPAIARLMNQWFVNVKVDREELPDVDRLYMDATTMLNGRGAWPNNLFLTPQGAPFYAGSYFPPKDDAGTQGFPTVLAAIHDLWTNHRAEKVTPAADEMMAALRKLADRESGAAPVPLAPRAWLASGSQKLLASVDKEHGGLGRSGPKFPQAPALTMLGAAARLSDDEAAGEALRRTLDAMAEGGLQDQLAGGFFRYATDAAWSVPHFEKMLTDNAQLLALYAAGRDPLERETARGIVRFLLRDMQLAGGGFATALDAQSAGVEGGTYLWTRRQIDDVLGPADSERFLAVYALTPMPGEDGADAPGVPRVRLPIADAAKTLAAVAPLRAKLLAARAGRPLPARDDKVVAGWNGLAIGALARAGLALQEPDALDAAKKAAALLWDKARDSASGALKHQIFMGTAAGEAGPEDYAALGDGLLDLAEATGNTLWRERAETLADAMLARFLRKDGALRAEAGLLPLALGDDEDADLPSGTSSALDLLGRLAAAPGGARFGAAQARIAAHLSGSLAARPTVWPSAVVALAEHPPSAADLAAAAPPKPEAVAGPAPPHVPALHVPATADHVHAVMTVTPGDGSETARVTLRIDPGWHVNAHVPSLDYLVPTDLAFTGVAAGGVLYPRAGTFKPGFSPAPLAVYEGEVTLTAPLPKGAAGWSASVTAQACDAHTCLPPSTVPVAAK